jgi:hypothetical protein
MESRIGRLPELLHAGEMPELALKLLNLRTTLRGSEQ